MPQRSIVRKRKKARRTKQLAEWREKQEQNKGTEKKNDKKSEKKSDAKKD